MAKRKNIQTPEDEATVSIPEDGDGNPMVWMIKTRTNSSGPLGDFYRNRKYEVPFSTYLEFHKNDEAILVEDK
jgi:hypothetical protein